MVFFWVFHVVGPLRSLHEPNRYHLWGHFEGYSRRGFGHCWCCTHHQNCLTLQPFCAAVITSQLTPLTSLPEKYGRTIRSYERPCSLTAYKTLMDSFFLGVSSGFWCWTSVTILGAFLFALHVYRSNRLIEKGTEAGGYLLVKFQCWFFQNSIQNEW